MCYPLGKRKENRQFVINYHASFFETDRITTIAFKNSNVGPWMSSVRGRTAKSNFFFTAFSRDGKGSTYPDLFGTVGILFEQPSSRGAVQDTVNGELTFPFSISNQFRASLSSIKATAALKDELLSYQRGFYENQPKRRGHYLASATGDPTRLNEFVRILRGHQIEVEGLPWNPLDVHSGSRRNRGHLMNPLEEDSPLCSGVLLWHGTAMHEIACHRLLRITQTLR